MEETQNNSGEVTLEDYIAEHQTRWSAAVAEFSTKMKKFTDLIDLQYQIYSNRQNALDYYFSLLIKVSQLSRTYKEQYAAMYNSIKTGSQIRYSSEAAVNAQIASSLSELTYKIELLENHAKFMQETIKTIDSVIYAINNRIRIEELIQGLKK